MVKAPKPKAKLPPNMQVTVLKQESLSEKIAPDNAKAKKWLDKHFFGGRIARVPGNKQRAKKTGDKKAHPAAPFAVPIKHKKKKKQRASRPVVQADEAADEAAADFLDE
ncbi:hypothetical protein DIPPA_10072 [Diplonema papillatum]|nr:hypothetical protein DIPPA_10072 [Diplonema papillatum]|eukprot:gene23005-35252_t